MLKAAERKMSGPQNKTEVTVGAKLSMMVALMQTKQSCRTPLPHPYVMYCEWPFMTK